MDIISKTDNRRAKRDKHLILGVLQCTYVEYFWCSISWVWFGIIQCTLQNFQFSYNCSSPKFHAIQPNFIMFIQGKHTGCHFYGALPKIAQIMALWNFLNTGLYAAGIFNFSHNFHCSPSKLCDNIGYHGKSECLLEYCNEKLASST